MALPPAHAETVLEALAFAYANNPEINAARANTRATDEDVEIAKGNLRPIVSAFGSDTATTTETAFSSFESITYNGIVGLQVQHNIFRGFRGLNAVRESEATLLARRELLRNTVQNVFFDAAQAYMEVVRARQILDIRRRNVEFLGEQVRAAQERFSVQDVTITDVQQTQARFAFAQASLAAAEASLAAAGATYREIVGHDPGSLAGGFPFASLIPEDLAGAEATGQDMHPVILASIHQADAEAYVVKQAEGGLLPTIGVTGTLQHSETFNTLSATNTWNNAATIGARVSIPLFQGGVVAAQIRKAKELYGELRIRIDIARDQVRAAIVTAWASVRSNESEIRAARAGVHAFELALTGTERELQAGQRTTLDVLNAQQDLLQGQEALVTAERDLAVANFALLSAMGRLNAEQLELLAYEPEAHFQQTDRHWYRFETPDGR